MTDARVALNSLRARNDDVAKICRNRGVVLMTAFGSAVEPTGNPHDLDLAVLFDRALPEPDVLGLLDDLIRVSEFQDVDLMVLNNAGPVARERALVGSVRLFDAAPGILTREQLAAILERMDTQWLRDLAIAGMAR